MAGDQRVIVGKLGSSGGRAHIWQMDQEPDAILARLRAHEAELRRTGVLSLSLFGSVARGDAGPKSDIDIVVRLSEDFAEGGFEYLGRLDDLRERLAQLVGREVDIVTEPIRKDRLRRNVEDNRVLAY